MYALIAYSCVIGVGVAFNLAAIIALCSIRRLRTPPNMFVVSLCVADVLLGFNGVVTLIAEFERDVIVEYCQVIGFVSFLPPINIVVTMLIIAENRYSIIALNSARASRSRVACYLASGWTVSVLVALPIVIFDPIITSTQGLCFCCFYFSSNRMYGYMVTVFCFALPDLIIAFYYSSITCHVHQSRVRIQDQVRSTRPTRRSDILLARQFTVLYAVFNVCYIPTLVMSWLHGDDGEIPIEALYFATFMLATVIVVNPILFFGLNKTATSQVLQHLRCKPASSEVSVVSASDLEQSDCLVKALARTYCCSCCKKEIESDEQVCDSVDCGEADDRVEKNVDFELSNSRVSVIDTFQRVTSLESDKNEHERATVDIYGKRGDNLTTKQ